MRVITAITAIILFGAGTVFGFTDNGNGTIADSRTGLAWQKQDDGITRTWENAITYCEGLTLAAQSDWRLPNIKELRTIVDDTKSDPAIDIAYFPNTELGGISGGGISRYWSSTTLLNDGYDYALNVEFMQGYSGIIEKTSANGIYVRCVRGGQ